jgi:hypothetical protein
MKTFFGFILVVAGIVFGCYAGIWWAFIGGIVDVITAIRADDLIPMDVVIGVAKVLFAGFIGYASAALLLLPGYSMLKD